MSPVNFGGGGGAAIPSLYAGMETFERFLANSAAITLTSGLMRIAYFRATKRRTVTNLELPSGSTAAGATPTLCRGGFYEIDEDTLAGVLACACANTPSLWAGTTTNYTPALSSGGGLPTEYTFEEGKLYAGAVLCVTAATAPQIHGRSDSTFSTAGPVAVNARGRYAAALAAQTDLPASFADAALTNTGTRPWIGAF